MRLACAPRVFAGLRQLGDQEVDITAMVAGITKYAVLVDDPLTIRYHLERAWHLAQSGRPGPCWLDIPVDVQAASIDASSLRSYDPKQDKHAEDNTHLDPDRLKADCHEVLQRIRNAKRPVILAGTGVRAAHAVAEFDELIHRLGVPVTTAWTHDLIATDDPLFCGRQGTIGDRAGNFTVQNADVLLTLGSRLNIRQTSYNWQSFAPRAFKIQVDIDAAEFSKPTVKPDLGHSQRPQVVCSETPQLMRCRRIPARCSRSVARLVPRSRETLPRRAGSPAPAGSAPEPLLLRRTTLSPIGRG